ncbi:MAG: segregation and condensation protein A [Thermodesulfovibrionales bacterium]
MDEIYKIKIPIFEGPLDLLLHLIRENKIDIYDIPISLITRQYLQYLEIMKELNLDIAGEFLAMAATLIYIKSRMLLPSDEEAPPEEQEDPRRELVERLIEYQKFKDAALKLREREEEWTKVYRREPELDQDDGEIYLSDVSLFDLLSAFKKILETAPPEIGKITKETLTVKDKMSLIMEIIEEKNTVRFEEFFKDGITRTKIIVTFIALLELIRLGLIRAYQERHFGNIWIIKQGVETHPALPFKSAQTLHLPRIL